MERLSHRLRLSRTISLGSSQQQRQLTSRQEAVRTQPSGPSSKMLRRTPSQQSTGSSKLVSPRMALIVLLDERRLELLIQPSLLTHQLLELIASHCQLREKEYFGLAMVDDTGHYTWLQLDRRVLDHEVHSGAGSKSEPLVIYFLVKFFIESITHLNDNKTIELFYMQARNLIFRGTLAENDSEVVFQLAALALQYSHGDFTDEAVAKKRLKLTPILPVNVLRQQASMSACEERVIEHYRRVRGQTRGQALVNYMSIIESMPTYGMHYFEVLDRRQQSASWLGLSCRGIAQYRHEDRKNPIRCFEWKQLENLYFRDKKFSIEVHNNKQVVTNGGALQDGNLNNSSNNNNSVQGQNGDALGCSSIVNNNNGNGVNVYVWFGKTANLTKCIWQSAISQHQFYLERKQAQMCRAQPMRTLKEIARDISINCSTSSSLSSNNSSSRLQLGALSVSSSLSNLSQRSNSTNSLAVALNKNAAMTNQHSSTSLQSASSQQQHLILSQSQAQLDESRRARAEMLSALRARKEALEAKLKEKQQVLKDLCIQEGELTGELPPEMPLSPGEPVPRIRRRVGTEFQLPENLLQRTFSTESNGEQEMVAQLELEHELQSKITSAARKLASDSSASKSVRKVRKVSLLQSERKLRDIEAKLAALHYYKKTNSAGGRRRVMRPNSESHLLADSDALPLPPTTHNGNPVGRPNEIRRGVSVPDFEIISRSESTASSSLIEDNNDDVDSNASPALPARSCPVTPRKPSKNAANDDLKHRLPGLMESGFIPSSVYLESSQRLPSSSLKHPDKLSLSSSSQTRAPLVATTDLIKSPPSSSRFESTLSPAIDSPVGLYNCPEQRTSQVFASMDDLDTILRQQQDKRDFKKPSQQGLTTLEAAATRSRHLAANNAYPSLERSIQRDQRGQSSSVLSLEDSTGSNSVQHLRNNEAYPSVISRHNVVGILRPFDAGVPFHPVMAASNSVVVSGGTLLPGQTYPEPGVGSDMPHSNNNAFHDPKVVKSEIKNDSVASKGEGNESPPPLYPKQYHHVVEQRRRSGQMDALHHGVPVPPRTILNASPAVNRKVKPAMSTPPSESQAMASKTSTTSLSSVSASASRFVAYRESSKPFEMADFYKYSTKFRKASSASSSSSLKENDNSGTSHVVSSNHAHNDDEDDDEDYNDPLRDDKHVRDEESKSIDSKSDDESRPPQLPERSPLKKGNTGTTTLDTNISSDTHSGMSEARGVGVSDSFSREMLDWYQSSAAQVKKHLQASKQSLKTNNNNNNNSQSNSKGSRKVPPPVPGKPATLV